MEDANVITEPEYKYCPHCRSKKSMPKAGIVRGKQRYQCQNCKKTTIVPLDKPRIR
jgi:transposase-like protein